ncbi:PoNe immunity protein domain-containing protein [Pseudoalteromonas sp. SWXJZ10B]|uniref:PoNe immunity protein domain-containing protein n=1 Tax=Pseudoalteromonas sp. SWXJZ10B TaxID=2792063 RepID=UPI0018CF1E4F|nr:PoNe immunity protein domain-containing protein [Pseudoalteromonas sp. SWXJZ10B]MBH0043521.1 DUF1911 domain-containing protein [Pseudoalteromonas sp. SWXJZ10B]
MLRDKLKSKAYFDEQVEFSLETIQEYIDDLKNDNSLTVNSKMRFSFRLVDYTSRLLHERYSRGDNLTELKPHLLEALEYRQWQKDYADALPANEQKNRIDWEELHEDDLRRTIIWLTFAYCLGMGEDYYLKTLELIANQGQDALLDNLAIAMGDSERQAATKPLFKKRFGKLYNVIEGSPEQRPELVKAYLDAWYKAEGSPDYHLMDTDAYIGYWCWGSALVVKLYNIDDSSFIDHPYYPKDLAHFKG